MILLPCCQVCKEWESKAMTVDNSVRLVLIRIGIVLDSDGGALGEDKRTLSHFKICKPWHCALSLSLWKLAKYAFPVLEVCVFFVGFGCFGWWVTFYPALYAYPLHLLKSTIC